MNKKRKTILIVISTFFFLTLTLIFLRNFSAEKMKDFIPQGEYLDRGTYYRGIILEVQNKEIGNEIGDPVRQVLSVLINSGDRKGETISVENNTLLQGNNFYFFTKNDRITLINYKDFLGEEKFFIAEYDRIGGIFFIILFFLIIIIYFGRSRGFGAVIGLIFSVIIFVYYMVPSIITGGNIFQVTLVGAILISSVALFLAHGFNKKILIVWLSTTVTLIISILISFVFINVADLFGRGSEFAESYLHTDLYHIDLRKLLFAGIIIGVLGILSDVTATQTAVIWELKKVNPKLKLMDLYNKSLNVGRQHIASLVNTLVLVYAGVSFPLFIAIQSRVNLPLWVIINSEPIAEEIIRTIVGTSSLILAVPISSILASYFIGKIKEEDIKKWDD